MSKAHPPELKKFMDRGAIIRLSQEEMKNYTGPVSYVAHHGVHKPDSATTPLRVVTNTSLKNRNANLSPNDCMQEGPNALSSLLEVSRSVLSLERCRGRLASLLHLPSPCCHLINRM